jgi:GT2 family glycosyltransferase
LLDRDAIELIGPLDPSYYLYYEDVDWCYRARLAGFAIVAAPRCVIWHKFGGSVSQRSQEFKMTWVVRNRMRYALVNMGGGVLRRYLPSYLRLDAREVLRSAVRRDRSGFRTYARGYWWLVREGRGLWRARRAKRRYNRLAGREEDYLALNVPATISAQEGREAKLTEEVTRQWYLQLFPLPAEIRPDPAS